MSSAKIESKDSHMETPALKKQKLMQKLLKQETLADLLKGGIEQVVFNKIASNSTQQYSNHKSIILENITPLALSMLDNLETVWYQAELLVLVSQTLKTLTANLSDGRIYEYTNKREIQNLVGHLLEDILYISGLFGDVRVALERYLGKSANPSDYWVIMTNTGRPIMVVDVKSPHMESVHEDPCVKGQIFDYMLDTMSFYGQVHVFGITTTMEKFRVHWFPHSDTYAATTTIDTTSGGAVSAAALMPNMNEISAQRCLHSSGIIELNNPKLVPLLVSTLLKSKHSAHTLVPLISDKRAYLCFTTTAWQWMCYNISCADKISCRLTDTATASTAYVVVKFFSRDVEKQVWLTIAQPSQQVVVLKFMKSVAEAEQERDLWVTVNGASSVYVATIREAPVLCMPLVIHAHEDSRTKVVAFNFDIKDWMCTRGAAAGALPVQLVTFAQAIASRGAAQQDVRAAALAAVKKIALQGVVHLDLEWRHVALMPEFAMDGTVTGLQPVLFDFGRVERNVAPDVALRRMMDRLRVLEAGRVW